MQEVADAVSPSMQLPKKEIPEEEVKEPAQPVINPEPTVEGDSEMKDEEVKEEALKV